MNQESRKVGNNDGIWKPGSQEKMGLVRKAGRQERILMP
jgi:hypothetical protein